MMIKKKLLRPQIFADNLNVVIDNACHGLVAQKRSGVKSYIQNLHIE